MGRIFKGEIRKCIRCNKEIQVSPSAIKRGKGKFCSQDCTNFGKSIKINCKTCGKEFTTLLSKQKQKRGKFCSRPCYIQDWNKRIPGWNKGKPAPWSIGNQHRKGKPNLNSYLKTNKQVRDKNINWKGDDVGYYGLHQWVRRQLGKPQKCEFCKDDTLKPRQYHWANKSGQYLRKKEDWLRLCVKCHKKYDL